MGLQDFEIFIQERLRIYDETLDLTSGSPIDTQVIQPLLRRIGTDPFTVDAATFIIERIGQEFPDLAASDGDAVSDLLTKPALLLWDPIIREIQRIKNSLSFRDPSTLTTEEADALGANLFAVRDTGSFSRGRGRIYFTQPQAIAVTQANFFTSRGGLHFFPTDIQSIKAEEMQLNIEGDLYYFDVNLISEGTGDGYNIGPSELVTIANVTSAVRVTNKARFRFGLNEEDAPTFIGRVDQNLSERSLVTTRGIASQLLRAFPEITRLNVVGFQDPEMQRDVLSGGSLGPMLAYGLDAQTMPDGEFKTSSRRLRCSSADFTALIGPVGNVTGYVITLFDMFSLSPNVRDLPVTRVVSPTTIEVGSQILLPGATGKAWALRKLELTISNIPGGILFPETAAGTISVAPDKVHIGGCTDILVRGVDFDTANLVIDVLSDQSPLLSGDTATVATGVNSGTITLGDYVLGTNYGVTDLEYTDLQNAGNLSYVVEIIDGPDAGIYRVLSVVQLSGTSPVLEVTPPPSGAPGTFRWKLIREIKIDLVEPKQARLSDNTGTTVQNLNTFQASPAIDFSVLGVSAGDTLRILNGPDAGDFEVTAVNPPLYTQLTLDRDFTSTFSGIQFTVFRPNTSGGINRPLTRITDIGLLDSSGQPVGSSIPYAKAVNALSRAFQNPGAGVKVEVSDATLGIVSLPGGTFNFGGGGNLLLQWSGYVGTVTVPLSGMLSASAIVAAINAVTLANPLIQLEAAVVLQYGGSNYVGIFAMGANTQVTGTGTVMATLFGPGTKRTSRDIRSSSVVSWAAVTPAIDEDLDAVSVLNGVQPGFYKDLVPVALPEAVSLRVSHDFAPEIGREVVVGARSLGSARVYFLSPTSAEVDQGTVFTTTDAAGNILNFKPDPTLSRQLFPALPNGDKPLTGVTSNVGPLGVMTLTGTDFVKKGIKPGDFLHVDFNPLTGGTPLADPVPALALKQLRLSLDSQPDKFVTFINDVGTPGAVSRSGVASQINATIGLNICSVVEVALGDFRLIFNPTLLLKIRQQNGYPPSANAILGFSNISDTDNKSINFGTYAISAVGYGGDPTKLSVTTTFPSILTDQQFSITRVGTQRIVTSAMQGQQENSLYYWDVELVSEGPGNLWNIPAEQEMILSNYRSDGYYLTTDDANLTFSPSEKVSIHFSRSFLEQGVDDDPENATQLAGQSVYISYEYSALIGSVQNFVGAESERVVNESPLARHLVPHFVRFSINYSGGSREIVVQPIIENYIIDRQPDQPIQASDLQKILSDKGASSIVNPINMLAVVHNFDRTITLARSQSSLTTGRLAAFIPDIVTLTRSVA